MKYFYSFLFTVCFALSLQSQEKIRSAVIEDTNLLISAEASSVSNVTFTIKPSIDYKSDKVGFKFPIVFKVSPFNAQTFRSKFENYLNKMNEYQQDTDSLDSIAKLINDGKKLNDSDKEKNLTKFLQLLKTLLPSKKLQDFFGGVEMTQHSLKEIYTQKLNDTQRKELKDFIVETATNRIKIFQKDFSTSLENSINGDPESKFKGKTNIRNRIERLFTYFDAQIVLLFKYDTEPVAGTLYYNIKNIPIQYFENQSYEIYFENRVRDYHELIKKLYLLRKEGDSEIKPKQIETIFTDDEFIKDNFIKIINVKKSIKNSISDKLEKIKSQIQNNRDDFEEFNKIIENVDQSYLSFISNDLINEDIIYYNSDDENEYNKFKELYDNIKSKFAKNDLEAMQNLKKYINYSINNHIKEQIDLIKEANEKNPLLINSLALIREHFSKEGEEYSEEFLSKPMLFLDKFEDIINNFRIYNRGKRRELIRQKLLINTNKKVYDSLNKNLNEFSSFKEKIDSLKIIIDYSKNKQEIYNLSLRLQELEYKNDIRTNDFNEINRIYRESYPNSKDIPITQKVDSLKKINNKTFYLRRILARYKYYEDISVLNKIESESEQINDLKNELINKEKKLVNTIKGTNYIKDNFSKILLRNDYLDNSLNYEDVVNLINNDNIEYSTNIFNRKLIEYKKLINKKYLKILNLLKKAPLLTFNISNAELDINDGFIEHIVILGNISGFYFDDESEDLNKKIKEFLSHFGDIPSIFNQQLKFTNSYPLGFSSTKDFDDFKSSYLYVNDGEHKQFSFSLDKFIVNYVQALQNDRLDFSPKDQIVRIPENDYDQDNAISLKKELSSKLFNISLYTDFIGLNDASPNGIIQFEFSKLMPLFTKRSTSRFGERYINRGFNYGVFNFITPQFRWSRLDADNNSKNLKLSTLEVFQGNTNETIKYVNLLDLMRFENISVGADLNLLSIDLPTAKTRFELNFGGRYGRTRVLDTNGNQNITETVNGEETSTIINTYEINTWRFYPEITFRLRPEERYGASVSFRPIRFNTDTRDFSTVSSIENFISNLDDNHSWLHQVEINAHFAPASQKDNMFFFRYRYTNNANWVGNGFGEVQVGYSMALKL